MSFNWISLLNVCVIASSVAVVYYCSNSAHQSHQQQQQQRTRGRLKTQELIEKYQLQPHPEGGFYRRIYEDSHLIQQPQVQSSSSQSTSSSTSSSSSSSTSSWLVFPRPVSSCIYFLVVAGDVSSFHRLPVDEHWFFLNGDPITIITLNTNNSQVIHTTLGDMNRGYEAWMVVKAGCWFAAVSGDDADTDTSGISDVDCNISDNVSGHSFVSCLVSGSFFFEEFELAIREQLVAQFPQHQKLIHRLCRK